MTKAVYLAGKMTDEPLWGFQLFEDTQTQLEDLGYNVISPHQYDIERGTVEVDVRYIMGRRVFTRVELAPTFHREQTLREDFLLILAHCDAIVMLPGWDTSDGACKERKVAKWAGLDVGLWDPSRNEIIWKRH